MHDRGEPDDLGNYCTCHEGDPWAGECLVHARALCPFDEPLHCDKDGCPACISVEPPELGELLGVTREQARKIAQECEEGRQAAIDRGLGQDVADRLSRYRVAWLAYSKCEGIPERREPAANDSGKGPETDIPF